MKKHHSQHNPTTTTTTSLSHYDQLHPKNRYYQNPPNLYQFAQEFPEIIGPYIHCNSITKKGKLDWKNPDAVRLFTQLLLWKDFQLQIQFPSTGYLCPPIPNRLNYLCWLSDLLESITPLISTPRHRIIDIGTGASLIYPLLGVKSFGWEFIATDIVMEALQIANHHLQQNPMIQPFIQLVLLPSTEWIQKLIKEYYLPSITASSSNNSAANREGEEVVEQGGGDGRYSKSIIPLQELVRQAIHQSSTTTTGSSHPSELTVNEAMAMYRGQIRHTFTRLDERYQYRLQDCEYSFLSSQQHSRSNENDERENNQRRRNKKSRTREDETYHDADGEEGESEEEDSSMQTTSTSKSAIVMNTRRQPLLSAVMTNPPFYDINDQIMENEETVCTGNETEMKTPGGEIGFIVAMIVDSLILRESVVWYTVMVGKKSSIGVLKSILQNEGIPKSQIFTTVFAQGVTYRWGLAWTFIPEAAALYMSYQLLQGNIQTNTQEEMINTAESPDPNNSTLIESQSNSSFQFAISNEEFQNTMTKQEKTLLHHILLSSPSMGTDNNDEADEREETGQPAPHPSVLLLLEEGKKRLAMILLQLDIALSTINLSKFPEILYFSPASSTITGGSQIQSTKPQFITNFIIQESNMNQQYYLFYCEIFVVTQPSPVSQVSMQGNAQNQGKKLLATFHLQLGLKEEGRQLLAVKLKLSSIFCSQGLASIILNRMKEHLENEFLRSNRRWRRLLQQTEQSK